VKFDVLSRNTNIHQNTLIEASAGTGKTFSIENIVIRLLIEEGPSRPPLNIDNILIVTFTRAAARELKVRIHQKILDSIRLLKGSSDNSLAEIDYLAQIRERDQRAQRNAIRNLERVICSFEQAQIFTIHRFCSKMLAEHAIETNFQFALPQETSTRTKHSLIRDCFRAGYLNEFSAAQLKVLLNMFSGDLQRLQSALFDAASKGVEIEKHENFESLLIDFNRVMEQLKVDYQLSSGKILQDFFLFAPRYKGICDIKGSIKSEIWKKVEQFSQLFDKDCWKQEDLDWLIEDQLTFSKVFDEKNLKKKETGQRCFFYPYQINRWLSRFISPNVIFAAVASRCQQAIESYKDKEDILDYDDVLKRMKQALLNHHFCKKIASRYQAAIVDEFQDTDPAQWEIFQKLFLNGKSLLYLVGDPKQSIYAFRQADIYTYLEAKEAIGGNDKASLVTNFRSQPSLVEALNALFDNGSSPGLFFLPKVQKSMPYPRVEASEKTLRKSFSDEKGAVHFFIADAQSKRTGSLEQIEKEFFLPFLVKEIQMLVETEKVNLGQIAILVADRYQAERVSQFLNRWKIHTSKQRSTKLTETVAFNAMRELLEAILNPRDDSAVKIALGSKLIRWTHEELESFDENASREHILYEFFSLRELFIQKGFPEFFQKFVSVCWKKDGATVLQRLLSEKNSEEFYQDLQQVLELLLEKGSRLSSPEALISLMDEIKTRDNDDEIPKQREDPTKDAVRIMTLHASKGLEFDIVFTLGLIKQTKLSERLIPVEKEGRCVLSAVIDREAKEYQRFCEEMDCEKIRQLYVAMTRAKFRVYNPILLLPSHKEIEPGVASPMELFLARFGHQGIEQSDLYSRLSSYDIQIFKDCIHSLGKDVSITYSSLDSGTFSLQESQESNTVSLVKPPSVVIPGIQRTLQSFTKLSSHSRVKQELLIPPGDFEEEKKTKHSLPAGSETGILLHRCLETAPYGIGGTLCSPTELLPYILPLTLGTRFAAWNEVIGEIVFHALKVPLGKNQTFSLSDVSSETCLKEEPFFINSNYLPGYLKGVVDLFFMHEGLYYLVDWKSNWLGPDDHCYHHRAMEQTMKENDYFLQADIYMNAIKKYLKLVETRPFEQIFGGVFFLFLRGLNCESAKQSGIYRVC